MALPGADASNLTALRGGGASRALLGNASEGRDVHMSTPFVHSSGSTPDVRARLNLNPAHWGVRAIAEIGVAIALAAVLSWLAQAFPLRMPQGGSFGLEMLPILFIAVRRGRDPRRGRRRALRPASVDGRRRHARTSTTHSRRCWTTRSPSRPGSRRPRAGGAARPARGVARLVGAVTVGAGARFVCHFLSGLIFFAEYAPAWEAPWLYSVTYNLLYLLPSAVVTALLLWPLLRAYDAAFPDERRTAG